MRILHLLDSGGIYGAESVTLNLMHEHRNMGLHSAILCFGAQRDAKKHIEREVNERGFQSFRCSFDRKHLFRSAAEIFAIARTYGAHILHSHNYKGNILVAMFSQKTRRTPAVATLHGWTHTRQIRKIWFYNLFDAFMMKRLDEVIVVSEEMRRESFLRMFRIKPTVIPNGIPHLRFEPGSFESECPAIAGRCSPHKTKLLAIGRLAPEKGFDVLIRAVSKACSNGHDVILVIMGDGPEKQRLSALVDREMISDRVNFIGYQDKAFRYITFFDAFILSSWTEGLPITLLESMQAGVPVIATSVGEIPAALNGGVYGRLVPPGDPIRLSSAISELILDNDAKKKIAERAKSWVKDRYGIQRMARAYEEVYRKFYAPF